MPHRAVQLVPADSWCQCCHSGTKTGHSDPQPVLSPSTQTALSGTGSSLLVAAPQGPSWVPSSAVCPVFTTSSPSSSVACGCPPILSHGPGLRLIGHQRGSVRRLVALEAVGRAVGSCRRPVSPMCPEVSIASLPACYLPAAAAAAAAFSDALPGDAVEVLHEQGCRTHGYFEPQNRWLLVFAF